MTTSRSQLPRLALLSLALFLASATPALGGTVTITGTEGRDELQVDVASDNSSLVVTPAATATTTFGGCLAETDSVTGRPVDTRCAISATGRNDLVIDLRGGDDVLVVNDFRPPRDHRGVGRDGQRRSDRRGQGSYAPGRRGR